MFNFQVSVDSKTKKIKINKKINKKNKNSEKRRKEGDAWGAGFRTPRGVIGCNGDHCFLALKSHRLSCKFFTSFWNFTVA